jgi:tRNA nucleotidyltransferase (CCA-adding enzyme)
LNPPAGKDPLGALPSDASALVERAAALATAHGWPSYLIGGTARDAVRGVPPIDLDISVVGDAVQVARELAAELGVEIEGYERFSTSTVSPPGSPYHLDFVTARRETYPQPGALPVVSAGTIEDDLARRDFTVNAFALELAPNRGALLDLHGGVQDLQAGRVAILHDRSFIDDPTRLFRAVRFAERLDFRIEPHTLELMLQAVRDGVMATVSVERLSRELVLVLEEPEAGKMLAALDRLGLLEALYPGLYWPYAPDDILLVSELSRDERRDALLAALAAEYAPDPSSAQELARYLRLPAHQVRLMHDAARLAALWPRLGEPELRNSELYVLLSPIDSAALRAFTRIEKLRADEVAWERLRHYLSELRHTRAQLTGHDLQALGLPPGPEYREILGKLLDAKLDGEVPTREEEERFVRAEIVRLQREKRGGIK